MKRIGIPLGIGLALLSILAFGPGVLLANHGEPHRPRPKPTPTPIATPTPVPVELAAPALISPSDGAAFTGEVTFVWSAVPGAACYQWQGATSTNPEQSGLASSCVTGTSYTILLGPGWEQYWPQLYWRVHARDRIESDITGRYGPWSETRLVYLAAE